MRRLWPAAAPVRRLHSQLVRRHLPATARYLAGLLIGLALQVPIPFLVSAVIDGLTRGQRLAQLTGQIGLIVGLSLASLAMATLSQIGAAALGLTFLRHARLHVFAAIQHAPAAFARRFNVSDLQARINGDLATLNHLSPAGLAITLRHLCCVLALGILLIRISPGIFLYIAGLLPLAALLFKLASPGQAARARLAHRSAAAANAGMLESLQGLREGRIAGARQFHFDRLDAALRQSDARFLDARRYSALMFGALGIIPVLVTALIWSVGAWQIGSGELTVGALVSFVLVLSMLYAPINGLFGVASGYVFEWAAFERVAAVCAAADMAVGPGTPRGDGVPALAHGAAAASLALHGVDFDYGGASVLAGLDAQLRAGSCTVLAGPNGCGKSTFLSLACGLDVPTGGAILFDNLPMGRWSDQALAARIGYLPQDVLIFGDTLRMNIAVGRGIDDAGILAAAEALHLNAFLQQWPQGLDTVILESGRDLSGGQRQKIALLRAVVHQPALLILDEPENNLDRETLQHLVRFVGTLKGRCTVLLVTHGAAFADVIDQRIDLGARAAAPLSAAFTVQASAA
jgi:ATP-binding cassette subfamily B protein